MVETLDATLTGQKRTEAPYTISLKPVKLFVIHTPPGHDPKGLHLARRDSATATTETRSGTLQVTDPGSGDGPRILDSLIDSVEVRAMVVITTNFNGFAGGTPTGGRVSQFIVTHNYVVTHNLGDAIGQSLGVPGQNFKRSVLLSLRYAFVNTERHHLTVLAASPTTWTSPARRPGDALPIVDWLASDPFATEVGGTTLRLDLAGNRTSPDPAWNNSHKRRGSRSVRGGFRRRAPGGLSAIFARPSCQGSVATTAGDHRGMRDASMSASRSRAVLL